MSILVVRNIKQAGVCSVVADSRISHVGGGGPMVIMKMTTVDVTVDRQSSSTNLHLSTQDCIAIP